MVMTIQFHTCVHPVARELPVLSSSRYLRASIFSERHVMLSLVLSDHECFKPYGMITWTFRDVSYMSMTRLHTLHTTNSTLHSSNNACCHFIFSIFHGAGAGRVTHRRRPCHAGSSRYSVFCTKVAENTENKFTRSPSEIKKSGFYP